MDIYIYNYIYIQYIHTHIIYNGFADQKYDIMWQSLKPKAPRREVFLFLPSQVGDGFPWRSPPQEIEPLQSPFWIGWSYWIKKLKTKLKTRKRRFDSDYHHIQH